MGYSIIGFSILIFFSLILGLLLLEEAIFGPKIKEEDFALITDLFLTENIIFPTAKKNTDYLYSTSRNKVISFIAKGPKNAFSFKYFICFNNPNIDSFELSNYYRRIPRGSSLEKFIVIKMKELKKVIE